MFNAEYAKHAKMRRGFHLNIFSAYLRVLRGLCVRALTQQELMPGPKHILLILILCVSMGTSRAQSVYVPLNHWAYDYVERMEAKGLITGALNGTKPYSREEMAGYLLQVEEKVNNGWSLSGTEMKQLAFLHFEFSEEFERLSGHNGRAYPTRLQAIKEHSFFGKLFPNFVYQNNRNLLQFGNDDLQIYIDPILSQRWQYGNPDSISGTDRVLERTHGLSLWGRLGDHIGFYLDARDTKEWGSRPYPNRFDITREGLGFVNGYGSHIWHDETIAYLMFKLPYLQVMVGRQNNYWGPGFRGALSLSDHATYYDQIKLQSRIWRLKFTWLWGSLQTFPKLFDVDGGRTPKNIVAHRLEVDVATWLDLSIYETVIFGNRRFELAYFNPINFYRSAEHALGDNDNVAMGMDAELLLIPNVKLYGELFVDDLFTSRIGTGWFGNKVAYLAGGFWVDAFTVPNLDARLEYARIRPYVYTHEREINTYSHFSTGLGHPIGPNADDLFVRLQYRFSRNLLVAANYETFRHGANEPDRNVGGDITRPWQPGDEDEIATLAGLRERRHQFGVELRYELLRNLFFGLGVTTSDASGFELPDGARGDVARDEVTVSLSLNR